MNKPRKINIIKALKEELDYYKFQNIYFYIQRQPLQHLQLKAAFTRSEVINMPKDCFSEILNMQLSRAFSDSINEFPIKTNFNQDIGIYEATVDLWVKYE